MPSKVPPTLLLALLLLAVGCGVETTPATNVTSSSATLNAMLHCDSGAHGTAWWELRGDGAEGSTVGADQGLTCPSSGRVAISHDVSGLAPDTGYEYRVALDPPPDDGKAPFRSTAVGFRTAAGRRPVVVPAAGWAR
jgi:hypothetical protein